MNFLHILLQEAISRYLPAYSVNQQYAKKKDPQDRRFETVNENRGNL